MYRTVFVQLKKNSTETNMIIKNNHSSIFVINTEWTIRRIALCFFHGALQREILIFSLEKRGLLYFQMASWQIVRM